MKLHKLTPARLIALSFFAVILAGAGLLMLPIASAQRIPSTAALIMPPA